MKKAISVMFCLLLCLTMLPLTASAAPVSETFTCTYSGVKSTYHSEKNTYFNLLLSVSGNASTINENGYTLACSYETGSVYSYFNKNKSQIINEVTFTVTSAYGIEPLVFSSGTPKSIMVKDGDTVTVTGIESNTFTITKADGWVNTKSITVTGDNPKPTPKPNKITVNTDGNGTASANAKTARSGSVITLTATPNEGYRFKEWQSTQVTVTDNKFTMPGKAVTVTAIFEPIPAPPTPPKTGDSAVPLLWLMTGVFSMLAILTIRKKATKNQ